MLSDSITDIFNVNGVILGKVENLSQEGIWNEGGELENQTEMTFEERVLNFVHFGLRTRHEPVSRFEQHSIHIGLAEAIGEIFQRGVEIQRDLRIDSVINVLIDVSYNKRNTD